MATMERGLSKAERDLCFKHDACLRCMGPRSACGGIAKCSNPPKSKITGALSAAIRQLSPNNPQRAHDRILAHLEAHAPEEEEAGLERDDPENQSEAEESDALAEAEDLVLAHLDEDEAMEFANALNHIGAPVHANK